MARIIKPASDDQARSIRECVELLKRARNAAALADSPKTLARIRAALDSADGARRHIEHRKARTLTSPQDLVG